MANIKLSDYLASLPNGALQNGTKTPSINNNALCNIDMQTAINNGATAIPFTNLQSNSSKSFNHNKNRKVIVQIYDTNGILRPFVLVEQRILNTITISVDNVDGGLLSGTLIFF